MAIRSCACILPLATSLLLACGGADDADTPDAGDAPVDGAVSETWVPLAIGNWTLPAGGENTGDNHTITLDRDIYVGAIRPVEPVGTHHTLLSIDGAAGTVYASGVGTNAVHFPEGVGLKLTKGTQLNLQLHIYNTSDAPLTGTSGVEIVEIAPEDVVHEADLFLPGPFSFSLPDGQETVYEGTCTVSQDQTVFALFPHMHQLGTHFKMTLTKGGQDMVLHDKPYNFEEQRFTVFEPIELKAGDKIKSKCTWFNDAGQTVGWGDSSNSEMCFGIMYRYPARGNEFCDDAGSP